MEDKHCISCYHWSCMQGVCMMDDSPVFDPEHDGCCNYLFFEKEVQPCTQSSEKKMCHM